MEAEWIEWHQRWYIGNVIGVEEKQNNIRASPAVRHTLNKPHQLPTLDKNQLLPELQRALAVENIAANFISSGNQDDMLDELRKLADTDNVRQDYTTALEGQPNHKCNDGQQLKSNQPTTSQEATVV